MLVKSGIGMCTCEEEVELLSFSLLVVADLCEERGGEREKEGERERERERERNSKKKN